MLPPAPSLGQAEGQYPGYSFPWAGTSSSNLPFSSDGAVSPPCPAPARGCHLWGPCPAWQGVPSHTKSLKHPLAVPFLPRWCEILGGGCAIWWHLLLKGAGQGNGQCWLPLPCSGEAAASTGSSLHHAHGVQELSWCWHAPGSTSTWHPLPAPMDPGVTGMRAP